MFNAVRPLSTTLTCLVTRQSWSCFVCLNQTLSFLKLQLLRPFDYKCPRLTELSAKSKQDKEYLDMAKQYKVSLIQTTRRVVWLDVRSALGSQKLKLLVTPTPDPSSPKQKKNGLSFKFDVIAQVSVTVSFQSVRLQKASNSQLTRGFCKFCLQNLRPWGASNMSPECRLTNLQAEFRCTLKLNNHFKWFKIQERLTFAIR